jgi:hypothetical protein
VAPPAQPDPGLQEWIDSVNDAYSPTDPSGILEVLTGTPGKPDADDGFFDRLVETLPARVGDNPAFDLLVSSPTTGTMTAQELLAVLEASA